MKDGILRFNLFCIFFLISFFASFENIVVLFFNYVFKNLRGYRRGLFNSVKFHEFGFDV